MDLSARMIVVLKPSPMNKEENNFLQQYAHCSLCHVDYLGMHSPCSGSMTTKDCLRCASVQSLKAKINKLNYSFCPYCGHSL